MNKCFLRASNDRSGAQINEDIFAWAYGLTQGLEYIGSFGDYNFENHYRLSKMLNIPLPFREKPEDSQKFVQINPDSYFGKDPNSFVTEEFVKQLRERYFRNNKVEERNSPKICVHIRRGDVRRDNFQGRYVPNSYFIDIIKKIKDIRPDSRVLIFSESESDESFEDFIDLGCEMNLDRDLEYTWKEIIDSDVFLMSVGSFSYVPAIYNKGLVIFYPAWYKKMDWWMNNDDPQLFNIIGNYLNSKYGEY